jgi:hypothetical protein
MTADDDRKVMMSVLVDFQSQKTVTKEKMRWAKLENEFLDHINIEVERLSILLSEADKSGSLDTQKLHKLIWDIAMAYQDYGVAFSTTSFLKAYDEYRDIVKESEESCNATKNARNATSECITCDPGKLTAAHCSRSVVSAGNY